VDSSPAFRLRKADAAIIKGIPLRVPETDKNSSLFDRLKRVLQNGTGVGRPLSCLMPQG